MALSAARASLRDEAPEGGPVAVRKDGAKESAPLLHNPANCCIGESPVISQGAFRRRYQYQPDPGTSLGPLPAAYRGPVMHPASFVRPSWWPGNVPSEPSRPPSSAQTEKPKTVQPDPGTPALPTTCIGVRSHTGRACSSDPVTAIQLYW